MTSSSVLPSSPAVDSHTEGEAGSLSICDYNQITSANTPPSSSPAESPSDWLTDVINETFPGVQVEDVVADADTGLEKANLGGEIQSICTGDDVQGSPSTGNACHALPDTDPGAFEALLSRAQQEQWLQWLQLAVKHAGHCGGWLSDVCEGLVNIEHQLGFKPEKSKKHVSNNLLSLTATI